MTGALGGPPAARPPGAAVPRPGAAPRPLFVRPGMLALVLVGGACGTLLRYLLVTAFPAAPGTWPWTTFWINVGGSLLLGALLTALARSGPDTGWRRAARLAAGTGFCGGLTTYSTFIVEVDSLIRAGSAWAGVGYAALSVVVGVAAALAGVLLMRAWPRRVPAVTSR
jgi:fluoride exporter